MRSHLSVAQTVGFALAGVVGMTIVLTSVQAYRDVMPVFDAPDSFMRGDYLVLSKRVGALQTIGLGSSDFTPGELEELKGQPFVRDVGAFTPANYRVKGTVGMGGVQSAEDVLEMMLAGATAVEVGAANLVNPFASLDIVNELPAAMEKYGINDLNEMIGGAHNG